METNTYSLVRCDAEWILMSSLKDYDRLHSLATIRAFRSRSDSWEVRPPYGSGLMFLYASDSPLTAAHCFLESMGIDGDIQVYS
jgi:hypothetical protein